VEKFYITTKKEKKTSIYLNLKKEKKPSIGIYWFCGFTLTYTLLYFKLYTSMKSIHIIIFGYDQL